MFVYILECETPGYYYVGCTKNLHRRIAEHRGHNGLGSKFVKEHGFKRLLQWVQVTRRDYAEALEDATAKELAEAGLTVKSDAVNVTKDGRSLVMPSRYSPLSIPPEALRQP